MLRYISAKFHSAFAQAPTTEFFVERAGFLHEAHQVVTSDGYKLGVSRIRVRHSDPDSRDRPVCLLVHGLMSCSDFFVCQMPNPDLGEAGLLENSSLPFFLASRGYDVWLLNNRGARYSCAHTRLSLQSDAFWDFSWSDMAKYDFPAAVKYIRLQSHQESLAICAFSQGTAQIMAALSMHLELASQIRTIIFFSPVLVPNIRNHPIMTYILDRPSLITTLFGRRSLVSAVEVTRAVTPDWFFAWLCYTISGTLFGWRMNHITGLERRIMYQNIASTTSVKVLSHWLQIAKSKTFSDADATPLNSQSVHEGMNLYAIVGQDDGLPNHTLFHEWFQQKKVNVLVVETYEHIETIWGRDWALKVAPFVEDAVWQDLIDWNRRTKLVDIVQP